MSHRKKIAFVIGTRPEAIKLAPLVKKFQQYPSYFNTCVIITAQHREMLDQVLRLFRVTPDYDLDIMVYDQTLNMVVVKTLVGLEGVLEKVSPDLVFVQGDTTTAFAGALATFHCGVTVAHIEAGLRSGDRFQPFPEEINRRLVSILANLHFVPTSSARRNLLREGILPEVVWVTGNTVIDALLWVLEQPYRPPSELADFFVGGGKQRILVTAHRRENQGVPLRNICRAIVALTRAMPTLEVIFSVHPNPRIRSDVLSLLRANKRVHLLSPLDYQSFVQLMRNVRIILTDSGGIQEEASSLGIPVFVLRGVTERREAVLAGTARVVGADPVVITSEVKRLLSSVQEYKVASCRTNLYGDGHACSRILGHVARYFDLSLEVGLGNFPVRSKR